MFTTLLHCNDLFINLNFSMVPSWLCMVDRDWVWSLGLMEFSYINWGIYQIQDHTIFFFKVLLHRLIEHLPNSFKIFLQWLKLKLLIRFFIVFLNSLRKFSMQWIISITLVASLSRSLSLLAIELISLQKQKKKDGFES